MPNHPKRKDIPSRLKGETLLHRKVLLKTKNEPIKMIPDLNVIKIGGQSVIDYGRKVVYPLVREIVELRQNYKMILVTGGGTRARHVYDIALDLGLPTGMLASLGEMIATQNALMMFGLLAEYGGARITKEDIPELPVYFQQGFIPIINGMPPYNWYEPPPEVGSIPAHRTDVGAYMLSEVMGARKMIYAKDERGLFTDNPKRNRKAKFIPRISASELIELNLPDLVVERPVLKMMLSARFAKEIQIINSHRKGNLTRAMNGESVGTIIYS